MKSLVVLVSLLLASLAQADVLEDFDTLGGNDVLLERAQRLNPDKTINVVQDRIVDRRMRSEIAIDTAAYVGGDAYTSTQSVGLLYQLHIIPQFSVGVRGAYHFNHLRDEGKFMIDKATEAEAAASKKTKEELKSLGLIPEIDYPKYAVYAVGNFYPIYGKMNIFNAAVAQYDVYVLGGAGQVELKSGPTPAFTAGAGIGLWLSQHLTSRFEVRWETWKAKRLAGEEQMNMTVLGLDMGYLL
jgi:outer membrane beta-barrel protein